MTPATNPATNPNMKQIRHEDLAGGGKADQASLQLLHDADVIFIRDINTENDRRAFGELVDGEPKLGAAVVFVTVDTANASDLHRVLNWVVMLKDYHEYYEVRRSTPIGTTPIEQERDRCQKLLVTIASNRGRCFYDMTHASYSPNVRLIIRQPSTAEEACRGIDWRDPDAVTEAAHKIEVYIQAGPTEFPDVRDDPPSTIAAAIREIGQNIAAECELMATRVEAVEAEPFSERPRAYILRDVESGETKGQYLFYQVAKPNQEAYELQMGRKAEIVETPLQEWESLQYQFEGSTIGMSELEKMQRAFSGRFEP